MKTALAFDDGGCKEQGGCGYSRWPNMGATRAMASIFPKARVVRTGCARLSPLLSHCATLSPNTNSFLRRLTSLLRFSTSYCIPPKHVRPSSSCILSGPTNKLKSSCHHASPLATHRKRPIRSSKIDTHPSSASAASNSSKEITSRQPSRHPRWRNLAAYLAGSICGTLGYASSYASFNRYKRPRENLSGYGNSQRCQCHAGINLALRVLSSRQSVMKTR